MPMIRDPADRISLVRFLAALSAAFLAAFALHAAAAPFVLRLGPDRIVLDTPVGFSDSLALASPRLQELAESLTSASNKVLVFAITDADLKRFMGGDRPDMKRYMTVSVPSHIEYDRISARQFAALAEETQRGMGALPSVTEYPAHLDKLAKGRLHALAELRKSATLLSMLQGTRLPAQKDPEREKPRYLLATTTLVLLRGKALSIAVYSDYEGAEDIEWIKAMTQTWVDELLRLNRNP